MRRSLAGKVAVKLHSGGPGGHYYSSPTKVKDLVQALDGTIVESDTAFRGLRFETASHKEAMEDHGFAAIAPVDIMVEEGAINDPIYVADEKRELRSGSASSRSMAPTRSITPKRLGSGQTALPSG